MKKVTLGIIAVLVLVVGIVIFLKTSPADRVVEDQLVENNAYSISFNYLTGQDGYELVESFTSDNFLHSYVLVEKSKLSEFQVNSEKSVPPTMAVFIFQTPEDEETEGEKPGRITRLQNWAQDNAGITAFEQIYGTPEIIEIDGVKGLEYTTNGTYQQSVFLASYRGYTYMFVGQYNRPTDMIKKDFEHLMESVRFE